MIQETHNHFLKDLDKPLKIKTQIICDTCKKTIDGYLYLDREELKVIETSGYLIFNNPVCDRCSQNFRKEFGTMVKDAIDEMGITPDDLGIDMTWNNREQQQQ